MGASCRDIMPGDRFAGRNAKTQKRRNRGTKDKWGNEATARPLTRGVKGRLQHEGKGETQKRRNAKTQKPRDEGEIGARRRWPGTGFPLSLSANGFTASQGGR